MLIEAAGEEQALFVLTGTARRVVVGGAEDAQELVANALAALKPFEELCDLVVLKQFKRNINK